MGTDKKLDLPNVFGENQRRLRIEKDWSQSELARQMQEYGWTKYSQVAVSRTEDGERMVRLDEGLALASVLETTLNVMVTPPESHVAWVQDLQKQSQTVIDAAKKLNDSAKAYETARQSALWKIDWIRAKAEKQLAAKSIKASLERELEQLSNLASLSSWKLLDWIEDEEWKIEWGEE